MANQRNPRDSPQRLPPAAIEGPAEEPPPNPGLLRSNEDLDRESKLADLALKHAELLAKKRETQQRINWTIAAPLITAIIAGFIGLASNAIVTYVNGHNQSVVERRKNENNLIIEAIKTGDREKAFANIRFFLDAGLVSDPNGKIKSALSGGAATPVLPGLRDFGSTPPRIASNNLVDVTPWLQQKFPEKFNSTRRYVLIWMDLQFSNAADFLEFDFGNPEAQRVVGVAPETSDAMSIQPLVQIQPGVLEQFTSKIISSSAPVSQSVSFHSTGGVAGQWVGLLIEVPEKWDEIMARIHIHFQPSFLGGGVGTTVGMRWIHNSLTPVLRSGGP